MKKLIPFTFLFIVVALSEIRADERLYGYGTVFGGFAAINLASEIGHFGAGGGAVYESGMGFSAEGGYIVSFGKYSEGVIVVDVNANYHFLDATPTKQLIPFFGAGYTLFLPNHSRLNFGGGIDYWIKPRTGIRFEVRDHLFGETNAVGIRAAFIFR